MEDILKSHPNLTLNKGVYIGGTILKELVWVTVFVLWGIKIELSVGKRNEERGEPKMMTATSTEHNTPSSYAFLKRPVLR